MRYLAKNSLILMVCLGGPFTKPYSYQSQAATHTLCFSIPITSGQASNTLKNMAEDS